MSNGLSIKEYWSQLTSSVHPDDQPIFKNFPIHTFDLRFPHPAYIGDIDNAKIFILMSNGAYKPGITEAEFPDDLAIAEYRNYISGISGKIPDRLSGYYSAGIVGDWIRRGVAVLVNAVAYRSPQLSREENNKMVAERLPSLAVHRRWLFREVLPLAKHGERFVFVHRNGWWKVPSAYAGPTIVFSDASRAEPNRQAPDRDKLELANAWIAEQK